MKIVVIDSGCNRPEINGISIIKQDENFNVIENCSDSEDHGNKVVDILLQYGNNIEITVIKIVRNNLNEDDYTDILMYALKYASDVFSPDLINISMGLECCYKHVEFSNLCDNISKSGIIIVAAYSNTGSNSYPAVFDSVIGVDWCIDCVKISQYKMLKCGKKIDIYCAPSIGINYLDSRGNSFLAPYVTATINNIWEENPESSSDEVKGILEERAYKVVNQIVNKVPKLENTIKRAILFPYNKEIKSILVNEKAIKFEIEGLFDTKYSKNFGKKVSVGTREFIIKNYKNIEWEKDFDTVILGHVEMISRVIGIDLKKYFVEYCRKYNKFLYSFGDLHNYDISQQVFYPSINKLMFNDPYCGRLFHISVPILVVLGTRSRQGKFFVQQKIREYMEEQDISVGYLSTEPSGYLLNADEIYPIGYEANVQLNINEQISCVNYLLYEISKKNKDIIITGGQSQILNNAFGNVKGYPIEQYAFLLACEPDEIILCVSIEDEIDYIERSIKFTESAADVSILAVVLFHKIIVNDYEEYIVDDELLENYKIKLEKQILKKVFRCDKVDDMNSLCQYIIEDLS